ncbi:MAG: CopG family transcriptional regulator [Candidatus Marinimicrobia bacterium]|nr:CopG family transcriptional regulator [Candidatus Neomarinimicrobiota bacterium]
MKSAIEYTAEPMGELKVVRDFLPPPHELVFEEETVKITIGLSRSSVDFFKREAKRNHTAYQKMIRRLLDVYASRYEQDAPTTGGTARR